MSSDIAIKVEGLSKCYQIYDNPRDRLKQMLMRGRKQYYREFWALRDLSFEIKRGETVGIIGRNGSGKSTLLQLICGTLSPTSGSIQTHGRIAALLELGSGFNPEFTGRENVYMNCSILGLSKEEIDARFEDIVSFADIGDFLDQPVKTYSSGMFVRLAFSVNIMSDPEIMVVDEALSVGDMAFQAKCMTALREIQNHGATILFVSHDVGSVKSLCTNAAHLVNGQLKKFGKASDVAEDYVRLVREEMNTQDQKHFKQTPCLSSKQSNALIKVKNNSTFKTSAEFDRRAKQFRYGAGGATIRYAELLDMYDTPVVSAEFNQEVKIKIYFDVQRDIDLSANYYINDDKKNLILGAGFITAGFPLLHCTKDTQYIVTYTTTLPLREGNYSVQLQLTRPIVIDQTAESLDVINDAIVFNVQRKPNGRIWASVYLDNSVEVESI